MKIYRYIPNGKSYDVIDKTIYGRWWPKGIQMGDFMDYLYPISSSSLSDAENHIYFCQNVDALPDFPGFALNCPVVSERAADVLHSQNLISTTVSISVLGRPFHVIQPELTILDEARSAIFVPEKSQGLKLDSGEVFHYHSLYFDVDKLTREFFTIPEFEPFSELFISERLLEVAKRNQLTGLENIELVFDQVPIQAVRASLTEDQLQLSSYRKTLELELYQGRAAMMAIDTNHMESAVVEAMRSGVINFHE